MRPLAVNRMGAANRPRCAMTAGGLPPEVLSAVSPFITSGNMVSRDVFNSQMVYENTQVGRVQKRNASAVQISNDTPRPIYFSLDGKIWHEVRPEMPHQCHILALLALLDAISAVRRPWRNSGYIPKCSRSCCFGSRGGEEQPLFTSQCDG